MAIFKNRPCLKLLPHTYSPSQLVVSPRNEWVSVGVGTFVASHYRNLFYPQFLTQGRLKRLFSDSLAADRLLCFGGYLRAVARFLVRCVKRSGGRRHNTCTNAPPIGSDFVDCSTRDCNQHGRPLRASWMHCASNGGYCDTK